MVALTGYGAEAIESISARRTTGLALRTITESTPLGLGGSGDCGAWGAGRAVLVMYGDTMLNVDLDRLIAAHVHGGPLATLFLHPNDHPHDSDLVEMDAAAAHYRPSSLSARPGPLLS